MTTYQPEKLNLWDRIFNRYKKIPIEQGSDGWVDYSNLFNPIKYSRTYVIYHEIDRLTGGYEIIKKYLN